MIAPKKNSKRDYIVMYFLIAVSGMVFFLFGIGGTIGAAILNTLFICYLAVSNKLNNGSKVLGFGLTYLLVFILLFFAQYMACEFLPKFSFAKYGSKAFLAFTALILVKDRFFKLYINTLYVLGIIGLTIHAATFAFPPFFDFLIQSVVPHIPNQPPKEFQIWHNYQIIIHDFWQRDLFRNSGPFWEPGANAGFTLLALFFNIYIFKVRLFTKQNLLFVLVVISTLSTTGYIVLLMVLFLNPSYNKNLALRVITLSIVVAVAAYAFTKFDFMGSKVVDQMNNTKTDAHHSRFASALLDLKTFEKYPLGFSIYDYRNGQKSEEDYRTNGVFIFLSAIGGIGFILYFLLVYKGMKKVLLYFNSSSNAGLVSFYFIIIILVMAFSENYFERPVFMAFSMFSPFFVTKTYSISVSDETPEKDILIEET